jgi:hypothetical protein
MGLERRERLSVMKVVLKACRRKIETLRASRGRLDCCLDWRNFEAGSVAIRSALRHGKDHKSRVKSGQRRERHQGKTYPKSSKGNQSYQPGIVRRVFIHSSLKAMLNICRLCKTKGRYPAILYNHTTDTHLMHQFKTTHTRKISYQNYSATTNSVQRTLF